MHRRKCKACAMRGRGSVGGWKQRIEIRNDGICNALTTAQKDSMYVGKADMEHEVTLLKFTEDGLKEVKVGSATDNTKGFEKSEIEEDDRWKSDEDNLTMPDLAEDRENNPDIEHTIEDYLYKDYGIFKLSPRECLRLMDVRDADIDKMMAINSNTQCYRQAGNSIVVVVLCAIFSQLNIKGIKPWNERTEEEKEEFMAWKRDGFR